MIFFLNSNYPSLGVASVVSVGAPLKGARIPQGQRALVKEFCRFYQLRPLMAPVQYRETGARVNSAGLVYFSEPVRQSLENERAGETEPLLCTSCLFMVTWKNFDHYDFFVGRGIEVWIRKCFTYNMIIFDKFW